jgi:MscS family membrane protein
MAISRTRVRWPASLLGLVLVLGAGGVPAQTGPAAPGPGTGSPPAPPSAPLDELGRGTPRGTATGFLEATRHGDYRRAAAYLDLRRLPPAEAETQGPVLARQLRVVLDQALVQDAGALSDDPEGQVDDGLASRRDLLGRLDTGKGYVSVFLDRVPRDDGVLIWKVSSTTVAAIRDLYREVIRGPMGDVLPAWLIERRPLRIALWQWGALGLLGVVAVLVARLALVPLWALLRVLLARSQLTLDPLFLAQVAAPVRLLVATGLFKAGRQGLSLATVVERNFTRIESVVALIALTWLMFRLIDAFTHLARQAVGRRNPTATTSMLLVLQRGLKLVVAFIAVLAFLGTFGVNVTALIAGLGVGGIAVALAAQKTLESIFGGVLLITDQPVRVGDFCRFGTQTGTVEEIGLRSTRVRTPERTVVSVPNAEFAALQIENFAVRDRILLRATIGLRYETTPDQLRHLLFQLRELIAAHPRLGGQPTRVRFDGFGAAALNVEVCTYALTADYEEFLAIREEVYLRVMELVAASGTGFAVPLPVPHRPGPGLDPREAGPRPTPPPAS